MKKRLTALLTASLILTLLPARALAAGPESTSGAYSPEDIWPGNPSASFREDYDSLPAFKPSENQKDIDAVTAVSKLNNLIWFAWALQKEYVLPFTDVPQDSWFYPGVYYVYTHSIMGGVTTELFAPHEPVSRGMAWTIFARMSGANPKAAPGQPWYEPGMQWAVEHNVTDGTNPLNTVTREQWVSMLWRRAGYPVVDLDLSVFSDSAAVSGYAQDAMRWAVSIGIIQGTNGQLSPKASLSRAELASMIMRIVPKPR